jgi:regulator of protease activity HflC (stomatin/prohibitin superfamily)
VSYDDPYAPPQQTQPAPPAPPTAGDAGYPDSETLLRRVAEIINNAKSMPLSSSVLLNNKDEVLELLEEALERLPTELRQARWMLKEREEFLARVQHEGDEILDMARSQAARMVQKTDIVQEAQRVSQRTVDEARQEARRLRNEAEDYCDQKLAAFEIVLERTMKTVQAGREKLQVTPLPPSDAGGDGSFGAIAGEGSAADMAEAEEGFFDQDQS